MFTKMTVFRTFLVGGVAALLVALVRIYFFSFASGHNLEVKLEGAIGSGNFRDAGASFNACLGRKAMHEGRVFRSGVWFSGWSCKSVGDPTAIFSLNFDPEKGREFYCRAPGENRIGRHFNTKKLDNLEFEGTWADDDQRSGMCGVIAASFRELASDKRVLIHCEAGRDRTGTYAAIVQALVAEKTSGLGRQELEAIECDYRRSKSLSPQKHGRMRSFLESVRASDGSVHAFVMRRCGLDHEAIDEAISAVTLGNLARAE